MKTSCRTDGWGSDGNSLGVGPWYNLNFLIWDLEWVAVGVCRTSNFCVFLWGCTSRELSLRAICLSRWSFGGGMLVS